MCLIVFSWKNHPKYDLVVAANRDEFYNRPTRAAQFWEENPDVLAGKDLKSGGTWLGITKGRRFSALTNYRDFDSIKEKAPSRGHLTLDFLKGDASPKDYLKSIKEPSADFNPFNLLVGDENSLWYFNNVNFEIKELQPGLYGLSNGLLDDPWSKVAKGKQELKSHIANENLDHSLFEFLTDTELAPDNELPKTGVPYDLEKGLSSLFIDLSGYGTRCSTILLTGPNETTFAEKTYDLQNHTSEIAEFTI